MHVEKKVRQNADTPDESYPSKEAGELNRDVVVTGANGFVGTAVVVKLHELGFNVRPCVRKNCPLFEGGPKQIVVPGLSMATDWGRVLAGAEVVIHTAGRAHVLREDAAEPLAEFRRVNVDGTLSLARQAVDAGVKRFVFISSIGVNGGQTYSEPYRACNAPAPHSPYAISKYEAERGLRAIEAGSSMEVVIVRPPLVYGPNAPGNFGVLTKWLGRGLPIPLGSVTRNRRSLVGIDNLVSLLTACIDHPAAAGQILLVSDDEDVSTAELLKRMGEILGTPARLISVSEKLLGVAGRLFGREDLIERLCGSLQVDITRTKEILGWSPPLTLNEGLVRACRFEKEARFCDRKINETRI